MSKNYDMPVTIYADKPAPQNVLEEYLVARIERLEMCERAAAGIDLESDNPYVLDNKLRRLASQLTKEQALQVSAMYLALAKVEPGIRSLLVAARTTNLCICATSGKECCPEHASEN